MSTKANLFLVGAMKAGTTSLSSVLASHSDIFLSSIKEPHYFVSDLPKNIYEPSRFFSEAAYFKSATQPFLHIAHIKEGDNYNTLFSNAEDYLYRLDASSAYLHAPGVVERLSAYQPQAKIIIITRNPLQRAFSHYKMDKGLGRTTASFEDVLSQEVDAYAKGVLPWNSYLGMSFYQEPIERFKQTFASVLVIDFETFIEEKTATLNKIAAFLEIEPNFEQAIEHKNQTRSLRFQKLFYILKKMGLKDFFSKLLPQSWRQKIFGVVSTSKTETLKLSEKTRIEINTIFKQESP